MIQNLLNDISYPEIQNGYLYNNIVVPRVTSILSAMLHEDYLMEWSNRIGLYQHSRYKDALDTASDIGTHVHLMIEMYITPCDGYDNEKYVNSIPLNLKPRVLNAFQSFLQWWQVITKNDYKVLLQEHSLTCEWFGGTLDLLLEINGKVYLVDFKTSNHTSYKHFLQLSAYRYMLERNGTHVDGCIILLLDKKKCVFTEYILNFSDINHLAFINQCQETFLSLVYAYYNRINTENMYQDIFGGKNGGHYGSNKRS